VRINKNLVFCFSAHNPFSFGIAFIRYAQNQKSAKAHKLKIFGINKDKGHKQDNQNHLGPTMLKGGELINNNIYFI